MLFDSGNLFSKSLKTKIDLSDRKKRSFSERHREKFKPKKEKEVKLFSEDIIKSVNNKSLKFTNHYSSLTSFEILKRVEDLSDDLTVIRTLPMTTVEFNDDRITKIIQLYIEDFAPKELNEDVVMKVSLVDSFGLQDGVRIYFIMNETFDAYEIILIDLYHLVIPSNHTTRNKKRITKKEMLNRTYEKNINNEKCISDYFHYSS